MRIYIASKSVHGSRWVEMRKRGAPFISTWIDESGPGQTSDWRDLTRRCVEEASSTLSGDEVGVVAIPCCVPLVLDQKPIADYRDGGIHSPENRVIVWRDVK